MQSIQTRRQAGFTLIEMLVIAPFVILLIGIFIVFLVSLTGDSLRIREKNTMAYDVQNALNTIESDATLAMSFPYQAYTGSASLFPIQTPQGSGNDAQSFNATYGSTSGPLLIQAPATTANPIVTPRQLVYLAQPDATCNASTLVTNDPYSVLYIYFVSNNTLWRRVILGDASVGLCNGPSWQLPSCSEANYASGSYSAVCKAADSRLLDNVSSMTTSYYQSADSTSPITIYYGASGAASTKARAIEIGLSTSKDLAGATVTFSGSIRVSSNNVR